MLCLEILQVTSQIEIQIYSKCITEFMLQISSHPELCSNSLFTYTVINVWNIDCDCVNIIQAVLYKQSP